MSRLSLLPLDEKFEMKYNNCANKLPNTLHELLYVALCDLEEVKNDSRYIIDMSVWHLPMPSKFCHVCLAGSVLAKSCEIPITESLPLNKITDVLGPELMYKLRAIDYLRTGDLKSAYMVLYGSKAPESIHNASSYCNINAIYPYEDPEWWNLMCDILAYLQFLKI